MQTQRRPWADEELKAGALGDTRLRKRLVRVVEALAAQPTGSVPQASGSWAATKATYRLWDSEHVQPEDIRAAHRDRVVERCREQGTVLALQDTTTLDFTHHPRTTGLGPVDRGGNAQGMLVHSVLVVSAQGVPLGILDQEVWARDPQTKGKRHTRRRRKTEQKESQRWITALKRTQEHLPEECWIVTIADREADIYDLFRAERRPGVELLIRAAHNRRVDDPLRYLWEAIRQRPLLGQWHFVVHRKEDHPAREVTLNVRVATLVLHPPLHQRERSSLPPVPMGVVLAEEENPPTGTSPICWLLLTTLPATTLEEAVRCVRWYSYRWLVERYHYVLKSGCAVEELQLETMDRLHRALATYTIVAWRLLWLTYEARCSPEASCETALERHEWESLWCTIHKTPIPPTTPPSYGQAVRWIAQLGGFLGRTHDGQPGVKVIWRGLRRLHDIAATWLLIHPSLSISPVADVGNA